jgi:hypothetical protein
VNGQNQGIRRQASGIREWGLLDLVQNRTCSLRKGGVILGSVLGRYYQLVNSPPLGPLESLSYRRMSRKILDSMSRRQNIDFK